MTQSSNLRFSSHNVLVDIGEETLRAGAGAHRLDIHVSASALWMSDGDNQMAHILTQGHVEVAPSRPVAALIPQVWTVYASRVDATVSVMLSDDQLLSLEAGRGEGEVNLRVDLDAVLLFVEDGRPTTRTQFGYVISPSRWTELLDGVGFGVGVTVRVPTPLTDPGAVQVDPLNPDSPSFSRAGQRLRQARQSLRDGDYEQCVQTCRKVLEAIQALTVMPSQTEVTKVLARDRDESQRWAALHYDLVSLGSAASHEDAITEDFNWTRYDADVVLASTAALLARVIGRGAR